MRFIFLFYKSLCYKFRKGEKNQVMTIIVTHISQFDIIHASDSNITDSQGQAAGQVSKLFQINRLNAGLTVAGTYSVGGFRMDTWMNDFIVRDRSSDLGSFVKVLTDFIDKESNLMEKQSGYFLHIAGYYGMPDSSHPEFYHITNFSIN